MFFLLILPWSTLLWHPCYYPHRSRDALSPVCGIFILTTFCISQKSLFNTFHKPEVVLRLSHGTDWQTIFFFWHWLFKNRGCLAIHIEFLKFLCFRFGLGLQSQTMDWVQSSCAPLQGKSMCQSWKILVFGLRTTTGGWRNLKELLLRAGERNFQEGPNW